MPEGPEHKVWKNIACGCGFENKTEKILESNRRLDCQNELENSCAEVEFTKSRITYSMDKLEEAKDIGLCENPMLVVKEKDFEYAKGLVKDTNIIVVPTSDMSVYLLACLTKNKE